MGARTGVLGARRMLELLCEIEARGAAAAPAAPPPVAPVDGSRGLPPVKSVDDEDDPACARPSGVPGDRGLLTDEPDTGERSIFPKLQRPIQEAESAQDER